MVFVPNPYCINIGDRVKLEAPMTTGLGTFTKGHEFTVFAETDRGYSLRDDDGNEALECSAPFAKLVLVRRRVSY